jgi:hypothetical protein
MITNEELIIGFAIWGFGYICGMIDFKTHMKDMRKKDGKETRPHS